MDKNKSTPISEKQFDKYERVDFAHFGKRKKTIEITIEINPIRELVLGTGTVLDAAAKAMHLPQRFWIEEEKGFKIDPRKESDSEYRYRLAKKLHELAQKMGYK